jgi:hypothetical protein
MPNRIDARIPLGITRPKIQSPQDAYSKSLAIRGQQQQMQIRDLQVEELKRDRDYKNSPAYRRQQGLEMDEKELAHEKLVMEVDKSKSDKIGADSEWIARIYEDVLHAPESEKPDRYNRALLSLEAKKLIAPEERARRSAQGYTPEVEEEIVADYKDTKHFQERHTYYQERKDERDKSAEEAQAALGTPEGLKKSMEFIAQTMAPATNQMEWDHRRGFLSQQKLPPGMLDSMVGMEYSEGAAYSVSQLGLSPKDQRAQASPSAPVTKNINGRVMGWDGKGFNIDFGTTGDTSEDDIAEEYADGVITGKIPPPNSSGARLPILTIKIVAALARKDYNLADAFLDWTATRKFLQSQNAVKVNTLRATIKTVYHTLDLVEQRYRDWQATGLPGDHRVWNRLALEASKQAGGATGAAAQALDTQVNDMVAEVAQVYMGGNSPTDHALKLSESNLKGSWDDQTMFELTTLLRQNLQVRSNSVNTLTPLTAGENPYFADPNQVELIDSTGYIWDLDNREKADQFMRANPGAGLKYLEENE